MFAGQHDDYVAALRSMGAEVSALDPLEAFPDAVFVEGAALCLQEGAVIMRPGAPSRLGEETVLATRRLDASGCFEGYKVLHTAEGEEACGNTIRFNTLVIMPAGFPRTRDTLVAAGYEVREVGNSEAAKLDGGMSCLSLRFSPKA